MIRGFEGEVGGLRPPMTIHRKFYCGADALTYANWLPTIANDGSMIRLPTNGTGSVERYDSAGNVVWTRACTYVNAACDKWGGLIWYDNVDEALWVFAIDTGATPDRVYVAKLDDLTGTITSIGSFQADVNLSRGDQGGFIERAAHGSGDFTICDDNDSYVISSSDGSIVSGPVGITLGGITPHHPGYRTADGMTMIRTGPLYTGAAFLVSVYRGGGVGEILFYGSTDGNGFGVYNQYACCILWDSYVATSVGFADSAVSTPYGPRYFELVDFDRWLNDIADILGLPEASA